MAETKLLDLARQGLASVDVAEKIRAAALTHIEDWLTHDKFEGLVSSERADYQPLLAWMIEAGKFDLLLDSFYQVMPFGTGGRRGPVGIGPNRINPFTIASSVQGHVVYLRERLGADAQLKVVVAYDVRQYADLRQLYPPGVPNPVMGMSSKDFAHIATAVYCAGGVQVHILPDDLNDYISTPELSFLIRRFGAHGGLNTSASHNHPDDNGGKFYNDRGGQEVPPYDEQMVKIVEGIETADIMPYDEAWRSGLVHAINPADRQAYIDLNLALRLRSGTGGAKIVYTPLHGTGRNTVGACLQAMGFEEGKQFFTVPSQTEYRGDFANVKFRTPNPEVPESLDAAIELAEQVQADLILATDPDADRIGGAVPWKGGYTFLNGNEFAAIVTRYRLESLKRAGRLPARPVILKTQVTTELMSRVGDAFGASVIGDLLVGFKYVGDIIDHFEREGRFGTVEAGPEDFIVAAEESHGLLVTPDVRDKDAAGAAVVLAELAADLKETGGTIYGYLIDTYKRYGYFRSMLRSTIMQGAAGTAAMKRIQQHLRTNPPAEIAGLRVESINDYWDTAQWGDFKSETDRSARDFITFHFEGGLKASVRPSGTEPKNKVYIEKGAEPLGADVPDDQFDAARRILDADVEEFSNAFMKMMLAIVGVELPDYGYLISDLVALERKQHFCRTFLPECESRAQALSAGEDDEQKLNQWIDSELRTYGPDARLLVAKAFRAYLAQARRSNPSKASMLDLEEQIFFS
ncbi:MAG: phospho-sugar mutase [Acidobacteria bacterium]|nr:phospho-sugar mutase [Acidobacteriota bacterium]